MIININKFKYDYKLIPTGNKGWFITKISSDLYCPHCRNNTPQKLAFRFGEKTSTFHCVKCNFNANLSKYLWLLKKPEYISNQKFIKQEDILIKKELINKKEKIQIEELEEVQLPLFFKRLKYSKYLQKRGAKLDIYKYWIIGKTDFEDNLKNYIIFVIQENGKNIGWVARSQKSKEEIDKLNKNSQHKILRWRNSKNDFGKIVFGLDEIREDTEQLIIVEGITSKMRIDCELELYKQNKIKCCCTFGKKITEIQLQKIRNKFKYENIILFYDSDAIQESKKTAYQFKEKFKNIFIVFCNYRDKNGNYKDAGDLNKNELLIVLNNKQSPFEFFETKMQKKKLTK